MTDAIAWVTQEQLISVRGDDARTWLNGQMTNDLKALTPERMVYGLILNVKGRILSDVLAIDHPEHGLLMAVAAGTWPVLSPHLEHYIIMEDVSLVPRDDLRILTTQVLETERGGEKPGEGWLPHQRLGVGKGWDRVVEMSELESVLASLGARHIEESEAEPLRIRAGRPRFGVDFGDTTYPQEAGLEKGAVSFSKGCYLGQEVVCMLESRGQVSRRLVALEGLGLFAGAELKDAEGTKVGEVTSATVEGHGIGFVKRAQALPGAELSFGEGATKATVLGLTSPPSS